MINHSDILITIINAINSNNWFYIILLFCTWILVTSNFVSLFWHLNFFFLWILCSCSWRSGGSCPGWKLGQRRGLWLRHSAAVSPTSCLSYLAYEPGRGGPAPGNMETQRCCLQCPLKYKHCVVCVSLAVWAWAGSRIPPCPCFLVSKVGLMLESVSWGWFARWMSQHIRGP